MHIIFNVGPELFQDIFEKVNKAYEFLCSRSKITEGPDPNNIVLILKAQSILFCHYREGKLLNKLISTNRVLIRLIV